MKPNLKVGWMALAVAVVLMSASIVRAKEPVFEGLGSYKHKITTESPEAQRYYNFLCIAYGGDPHVFGDLVDKGILPKHRAGRCTGEYEQVRKAFNMRIMPYVDPDLLVRAKASRW